MLAEVFPRAENHYGANVPVALPDAAIKATDRLFAAKAPGAYRQALVGSVIARILNPDIDIRFPATEEGPDSEHSYSGRSLDEGAVMPFLRQHAVPILEASAYLGPLRGGARFVEGGAPRIQRDKVGFAALVAAVDYTRNLDKAQATEYLCFVLRRFVALREAANIPLRRLAEPKLEQLSRLVDGLLDVKSGGRVPAFIATAMFRTISECHGLAWDVECQGINVADKVSGAVGDITIRKNGALIRGIEVTERPIGAARVRTVFDEKISPNNIRDYLFVTTAEPDEEAHQVAQQYTAAGNEINFVNLRNWVIANLASIGPACRTIFQDRLIDQFSAATADLKVAWNEKLDAALGINP